ncbi:TetR/AcrR family transcriptional regulator [Furfurilactobacillus milii]|uniref:HTH tetR-type domain-containing protein n=1 Tax=Furfurilactobacillus milii TaxID=2888272 RepID=A0A6N9I3D5_9LACO|nr:TetR/AcrR family transcriptional regulator [Furfurilactobacillus milii]MYV17501.1 hypothetical protein [Furfurilactobacillus milii]
MQKIDQRTYRTKRKIESAMLQLCHDNVPFAKLTGPQVAQTAHVSRQTFYRYYLTPEQVIVTILDRHLDEFLSAFRFQDLTAQSMVIQLLQAWQKRTDAFEMIEWSNIRQLFIQRLANFNHQIALRNSKALIDETTICNVYAAATYMFLRDYVLEHKWTPEQAAKLLLHLTNGLSDLF